MKKIIVIIFILSINSLFSKEIDSLKVLLNTANDTNKVDIMLKIADNCSRENPKMTVSYAEQALKISKALNDTSRMASSYNFIGLGFEFQSKYESALVSYNKSIELSRSTNDTSKIIRQYINIGLTYYAQGYYDKTIEAYTKGLDIAVKNDATSAVGSLLNNIGLVYQSLQDYDKALEYYQRTYDIRVKNNDPFMIARALSNIGSVYSEMDESDKALSYNQNALKYFEEVGFERGISKSLNNIGINYISMGQYQRAIKIFNRSLKIKEKTNDIKGFIKTYQNFAVLYSKIGNKELAFKYLKMAEDSIKEHRFNDFQSEIPYHYYEVNSNLGNHEAALEYYIQAELILDSIRADQSKQRLSELEVKYESLSKEKENELLKNENKIKHLELKEEISLNQVLIFLVGAFLFVVLIIVYLYSHKRKTAKLLAIRNKELAEINKKLKQSETELKYLGKTKDKLYTIIAHDLINPITVFISLSDYLISYSKELSRDDFEESLVDINSSARGLMHLLKNLLQWSRQQSGIMEPKMEEYDINDMIMDNIQLFRSDLSFKKLIIDHNLKATMAACFDINMINTVIRNLISNAIKFSNEGGRIHIETFAENGSVLIKISDSGVGIDEDHIKTLFDFEKAYSTPGTNHEIGTGLGLLICKEFVELSNGKIWVESKPNEGTTFSFSLQAK